MANKEMRFDIVLNAIYTGFAEAGDVLKQMGEQVQQVSRYLIDFGKESVTVYKDYEQAMADAEVALSTKYGRGTKELRDVMDGLNQSAAKWAESTKFHTQDVAAAISEAAHAGWDYNEILLGIPAAMKLALAGGIDLSEALDYTVKAANGAGVEFEKLSDFMDIWVYAANSSATTVDEFGEAMLRMGGTMRWAANPEELMTMIATLANFGTTGDAAGTLLRNSMIRLVAPTQKARNLLTALGADTKEVNELIKDKELATAMNTLIDHGFKGVYDESGKLRPMLDIYADLALTLGDMAGGIENITKDEKAMQILSSIFPTRSITGAIALLTAASQGWDGLYDSMMGGEAKGYGEYASNVMMGTLEGQMTLFDSKIEEIKRKAGEDLAPYLTDAMSELTGVLDGINSMDSENFELLVNGLVTVAGVGVGLGAAGTALKLLSGVFTPIGLAATGITALAVLFSTLNKISDQQFDNMFGNMSLDEETIGAYVASIGEGYESVYSKVKQLKDELDSVAQKYRDTSSELSGELFTGVITKKTFTPDEISNLQQMGEEMYKQLMIGISLSKQKSESYWAMMFENTDDAEGEIDPAYQEIKDLINAEYNDAVLEAQAIGQKFRDAMTKAFADGKLTPDEYENILSYMRDYNKAMARAAQEAQKEEDYVKTEMWLYKAQHASAEDAMQIARDAAAERDRIIEEQRATHYAEMYRLEQQGASQATKDAANREWDEYEQSIKDRYNYDFMTTLLDTVLRTSDLADAYGSVQQIAVDMMTGKISVPSAHQMITDQFGGSAYAATGFSTTTQTAQLGRYIGSWVASMGGEEAVQEMITRYRSTGDVEKADNLTRILAMESLLLNGYSVVRAGEKDPYDYLNLMGDFSTTAIAAGSPNELGNELVRRMEMDKALSSYGKSTVTMTLDEARALVGARDDSLGWGRPGEVNSLRRFFDGIGTDLRKGEYSYELLRQSLERKPEDFEKYANLMYSMIGMYDMRAVIQDLKTEYPEMSPRWEEQSDVAVWSLLYGPASQNAGKYLRNPQANPEEPASPWSGETGGRDSAAATGVAVEPDVSAVLDAIKDIDGNEITIFADGDTTELNTDIRHEDGQQLTMYVDGDMTQLDRKIRERNGKTIMLNVGGKTSAKYAEGGRATEASIFGEAGPEWAIPEEHSERTAELLNAAREASGFTWPDIIARFGGLNANARNTPQTIVYSPTINAQDATGVERALAEDKTRLEKWFREREMREEMEVFA